MGFLASRVRDIAFFLGLCSVLAAPMKRAPCKHLQTTQYGDVVFGLGNITYLANVQHPKAVLSGDFSAIASQQGSLLPFTVIFAEDEVVTGSYLQGVIARYQKGDDVFTPDFLAGVYIASNGTNRTSGLDASALEYLTGLAPRHLFLDTSFGVAHRRFWTHSRLPGRPLHENFRLIAPLDSVDIPVTYVAPPKVTDLTAGPYAVSISDGSVSFGTVYRLYRDTHRNFLYGTYNANDGKDTFNPSRCSEPGSGTR